MRPCLVGNKISFVMFVLWWSIALLSAFGPCNGQAPAPETGFDEILSDAFVYNLDGEDYEGTLFMTGAPEANPLLLFVADPFLVDSGAEMEVIMHLVRQDYSVAMIDNYGTFRNADAFTETLTENPNRLIDHLDEAWRILDKNPLFLDSERAIVSHGLGATLAIAAARTSSLDVTAIIAISPPTLEVSGRLLFGSNVPIALYLSHNGPVQSSEIFSFENELRPVNASYEVTRFSTAKEDILDDTIAKERTLSLMTTYLSVAFDPDQLEYLSEPFNETNVNDKELGLEFIDYQDGSDDLRGFLAYPLNPPTDDPLPLILISPDWDGIGAYELWRAKLLAHMGYVAFAADIYGIDVEQGEDLPIPERQRLTGVYGGAPFVGRLTAAIDAVAESDSVAVDMDRIAMTGYCFGGSGVLELAAADIPGLKGVITFHAGILLPETQSNAECQPVSVLILNGADDSSVTPIEINGFFDLNTELNVTWEFTNYGGTLHGFTDPTNDRQGDFVEYSPYADVLSFASFQDFLEKIFVMPGIYEKCELE